VSLTIAAGLGQIGEFSFILMTLAVVLELVPPDAIQLVVTAALVSISLSPFMFRLVEPLARRADRLPPLVRLSRRSSADLVALDRARHVEKLRNHAIVCGHGRVGRLITSALDRRGFRYVVITTDRHDMARLRDQGTPVLFGDAADPALLALANLAEARVLIVAIADSHASRLIVDRAHELASRVSVVVRTHSAGDLGAFHDMEGSVQPVMGEVEVAVQMTRYALTRFGVSMLEAEAVAQGLRGRGRAQSS
jgi:CPA2 family monovalent cation:H+ antiporter-2